MGLEIERRDASSARVPRVDLGHAIVFTRYDDDHAVVLSPADFARLAALEGALEQVLGDRPRPTAVVERAHRLEDEPGVSTEDNEAITRLLGL